MLKTLLCHVLLLFLPFKLLRETPPDGDKFAWMVEVSSICIHTCYRRMDFSFSLIL